MNATIDQKAPLSPNDPAYYAPRAPRDLDAARLPKLGETTRPFSAGLDSLDSGAAVLVDDFSAVFSAVFGGIIKFLALEIFGDPTGSLSIRSGWG